MVLIADCPITSGNIVSNPMKHAIEMATSYIEATQLLYAKHSHLCANSHLRSFLCAIDQRDYNLHDGRFKYSSKELSA